MGTSDEKMNDATFNALIHQIYRTYKLSCSRNNELINKLLDLINDIDNYELNSGTIKLIITGLRIECNSLLDFNNSNLIRNDLNRSLEERSYHELIDED